MDLYDKLIVTAKFEKYANHNGWLCAQYQVEVLNPDNDRPYSTVFRVGLRDEIVKDAALPYGLVDLKNARKQVEYLIRSGDVSLLGKPTYKPSKQYVLYAICSDAENTDQPFEDWAADLGTMLTAARLKRFTTNVSKPGTHLRNYAAPLKRWSLLPSVHGILIMVTTIAVKVTNNGTPSPAPT